MAWCSSARRPVRTSHLRQVGMKVRRSVTVLSDTPRARCRSAQSCSSWSWAFRRDQKCSVCGVSANQVRRMSLGSGAKGLWRDTVQRWVQCAGAGQDIGGGPISIGCVVGGDPVCGLAGGAFDFLPHQVGVPPGGRCPVVAVVLDSWACSERDESQRPDQQIRRGSSSEYSVEVADGSMSEPSRSRWAPERRLWTGPDG